MTDYTILIAVALAFISGGFMGVGYTWYRYKNEKRKRIKAEKLYMESQKQLLNEHINRGTVSS